MKLLKITDMKKKDLLKRIEILESMVGSFSVTHCMGFEHPKQPCPTVAKFKRIADYAQAITEEIATPRKTLCKHQYEDVNEFLVKCKYCGDKVAI